MKLDTTKLDELTTNCKTPGDVAALYSQLLQRVIERGLNAEMDAHLGYGRHEKAEDGARQKRRNGGSTKTLKGSFGELAVTTPRDRAASFE